MMGDLPSQPKATILVVDDEAAVRRVLVMRLQLSGYRVICAEDGEQALETVSYTHLRAHRDKRQSRMPSSA